MTAQLRGIDVSHYQGHIDWHAVKASGIAFAAVEATYGLTGRDATDALFRENWAGMKAAGLVRGAYHFFYAFAGVDGAAQADHLHAYVRDRGHFAGGDFVLLDLEEASINGQPPSVVLAETRAFVQRARRQIAKPVFLYTDPNTWNNLLGGPHDRVLATCPLWLADYGSPPLPALANWPQGPSFWQHSSQGHVPGVSGEVDLDVFFGSMAQLKKLTAPLHPAPVA